MARNLAGTWDGAPNYRWKKMVAGTTWYLLCRGQKPGEQKENTGWLGLDEKWWTKPGSSAAAGEWWKKRWLKAATVTDSDGRELHLAEGVRSDEMVQAQATLQAKVNKLARIMERMGLEVPEKFLPVAKLYKGDTPPPPSNLASALFQNLDQMTEPVIPQDRLVSHWRDQFLALMKSDGNRGPGRYDNVKRSADRFVVAMGAGATIDQVNEASYQKFFIDLIATDAGDYFKRDTMRDVRMFMKFLYEQKQLIEPLRNLKSLKVQVDDQPIEHFTVDELRAMLKNATGHLKLFIYFFCNCGMRQKDVSTITHAMFDGKHITRKRGKTRRHRTSPLVTYKLWPETLELINQFKTSGKGSDLLFVQPNGKQWVLDEGLNDNGKRKRDDNFSGLWKAFKANHPQRLKAMDIRGSAANLITGDNRLSLQVKYLSDVPSGVILKHYLEPTQPEFNQAVDGLRKVLHQPSKRKAKAG